MPKCEMQTFTERLVEPHSPRKKRYEKIAMCPRGTQPTSGALSGMPGNRVGEERLSGVSGVQLKTEE